MYLNGCSEELLGDIMFEKLKLFYDLFRKGQELANAEVWKGRQVKANILGGFILAIVALIKAFGHELPVDENAAMSIAGGIIAIVNVVLTLTTSKKVGLPAKPDVQEALPAIQPELATVSAKGSLQSGDTPAYTKEQLAAALADMESRQKLFTEH